MNSTNRGANRTVILLAGLVLLALGLVSLALGALPGFSRAFDDAAPGVTSTLTDALKATPFSATGHSWLWLIAAPVLLVFAVLFVVFIARQGRGHTRALLSQKPTDDGSTVVDASVAEDLLKESLASHPELVGSRVTTYDVKGTSVLKVSVSCRRGVSPVDARDLVEQQLIALDALLGTTVPALIQVSGGFRTRTAGVTRLA
ncbi:hypothetical protein [Subtercola boreus]|uniref:Alkaline shock response membrane anchor protein AmaP n=1 Tax=Subtercola boreus TaxID=120213 RepID=A0A3E0WFS8_9MICO|nr:hypothetical protein [Subtercola boreus]RFA23350.1 hypothetical protein B7R24_00105 [Subtercola boreus]RFA23743.1 hypothetical protein B7R23_00105 [Subtercola boreus]RFA29443.1 hypothetical protein B7R25_00100 [Subtercola boreus]